MWVKIHGLIILLSIYSQVLCDTTVLIKLVNYTINTYGTQQGTQQQRCCVTGKLLKPFICDKPCSPSLRFCVSTDPFGGDTCSSVESTSNLPATQTYKAGTTLGNTSNPVALTLKSWSVSSKIEILISAQQFNYTLILATSVIQPLIWPVPKLEPLRWRTVVDNLNDHQVIVYQYKVFTSSMVQSDRVGCDPGFYLNGIFCHDIDECTDVKNVCNNGTCRNTRGSFNCYCNRGYMGKHCQDDEDECKGIGAAICGVGHSYCVNTIGSYKCVCYQGYTGPHCLNDMDECLGDPCANTTSICINIEGSYKCVCPPGFTNDNCDVDIDECNINKPCHHSSTCINTNGSYRCDCSDGFTGQHCDVDINECRNRSICNNNSTCTNLLGSYTCNCATGFTGRHCEVDIDECLKGPCLNQGVCINTFGGYYCDCRKGLIGDLCQYDHNECLDLPCKNNGTCVNGIGSFSCKCDPGFTGEHCELGHSPCQNGGTLLNTNDGSRCQCLEAYSGTSCETVVDLCLNKPCKHGGSCETLPHSYHCHCTPSYAGTNCTEDFDECQYGNHCGSHGNCINTFGSYRCSCLDGFTGTICDRKVLGFSTSTVTVTSSDTATRTETCEDTPGFPCQSTFNMCREKNIAEQQCRKTCRKCGAGLNIVG